MKQAGVAFSRRPATRRTRCWRFCLLLVSGTALLQATPATANDALLVTPHLSGNALGTLTATLEDPTRSLTIEQASAASWSRRYVQSEVDTPNFGLTESAYWVRLNVANRAEQPQPWMLELAYPPLDEVLLFVPRDGGGFDVRKSGDHESFASREVQYRTFLFQLNEPPGARTYYLRVQTSGSVSLPLRAWSSAAFLDHLLRELPPIWSFYGLMLIMAAYNLFVFVSVRERAYLYYVLYILSYVGFQFSLSGLSFQYLWPNQIWWNSKALTLSIGAAFTFGALFQREFLASKVELVWTERYYRFVIVVSIVLAATSLFTDYATSIRVQVVWGVHVILFALFASARAALTGSRSAVYYLLAWLAILLGILLYLLQTLGVLPTTFVGQWGLQLGAAIEVTLLSLGLADRINVMRAELQLLNGELSHNVNRLSEALDQAQAATRAKGEFLASVSHELRTPLNAIINIPEGILEDFHQLPAVLCSHCGSIFALDPGEAADFAAACPECAGSGSLRAHDTWTYDGNPAATARHLKHVHSASKHLLGVVSSILDFSKLEAAKMELNIADVDLAEVLDEALSPLGQLAARKGVSLVLPATSGRAPIRADRVRLAQVLLNLVGNAIKFSDKAGVVRVELAAEDDTYLVRVHDEGIGIAPADRARIFDSFSQVDSSNTRQFGGTGLGLAISKSLVELHGGSIWVDSELGKGSTFSVRLPKAGPTPEPREHVPSLRARTGATDSWAPPPGVGS
jgi:two-component system, sensor histidine kinase LadS